MLAKPGRAREAHPEAVREQLTRLVESPGLQHAESLCHLLKYLVEQSLAKPQEHLKEYQIATEVFGRSGTFDPRLDSTVRVQTSRLRNKLIEFYATIGVKDPIIIEIPKGTYLAVFHAREADASSVPAVEPVAQPQPTASHARMWIIGVACLGFALTCIALGYLIGQGQRVAPGRELRIFWSSFLKSKEPPLIVFSNAAFKGRPEIGLRYFEAGSDSREEINDLYTGVGEVLAIGELSRVFRLLDRNFVVKRSALLNWDETRDRDLIFAGSPTENLSSRDLPGKDEFAFGRMKETEPRPGDLAIINTHPKPGEPSFFFASSGLPITEDYAVVTLRAGLHHGQNILMLAGTTTLGTEAAAEFVTQNDHLEALRKRLGVGASGYPPFSVVLRVRIARGVPVESNIVAARSAAITRSITSAVPAEPK